MSSCGIELTCAGTSSLATGSRVAVAFPPDAVTVSVVDTRPTDMTTSIAGVSLVSVTVREIVSNPRIENVSSKLPAISP